MTNFEDIKVGDEVVIRTRYNEKITRVTKVCKIYFEAGNKKFRKDNGYEYGSHDSWSSSFADKCTEERKKKILEKTRKMKLCSQLKETKWEQFPITKLEAVIKTLNEDEASNEASVPV